VLPDVTSDTSSVSPTYHNQRRSSGHSVDNADSYEPREFRRRVDPLSKSPEVEMAGGGLTRDRNSLTVSLSTSTATERRLAVAEDRGGRYAPSLNNVAHADYDDDRFRLTSVDFRCHRNTTAQHQLEPTTPTPGGLSEWYFSCHHHHGEGQADSMTTDRFALCSVPGLQPVIAAQY